MSLPFDHFEVNGVAVSGNPITFTMDEAKSVVAVYRSGLSFLRFLVNGVAVTGNPITFITAGEVSVIAVYESITALIATWPSSPQQAGVALAITFTFSNYGADGTYTFTLRNAAGTVLGSVAVPAANNTTYNRGRIDFTMPSSDVQLTLTCDYGGYASATIQVLILVSTTLTLLIPSEVGVSQTVSFSGKLSRQDGGSPGVQTIAIISGSSILATVTTQSDGSYTGQFTAPATRGSYQIQASFSGSGYLASSISRAHSLSNRRPNRFRLLPS